MNAQGIEDIYELSPLQQGMLFHTLYEPASRLYFEQVMVPFEATVNLQAFEQAWTRVADTHSTLRTSFHWEDIEKPVQVVHKKVTVPIENIDLRDVPPPQQDIEIEGLLAADRRRGFDMGRPPLLRVTLVQTGIVSYRLLLSFHHSILDGWSMQILFRQLSSAYHSFSLGQTPNLPRSHPFSDYIRWLQRQDLAAAEQYWRKSLAGAAPASWIPAGALTETGGEGYSEHEVSLSEEATARLRDFAASHKLTLNTLVQGAWALLIGRLSGSDDVIFGATVSGRPSEFQDVENMTGLFINTVPVRAQIDFNATVGAWLQALQAAQFEARQFDYSPLVRIREWSGMPGSLFDTLVAFENYPVEANAMNSASPATFVERTNYPLSAAIVPRQRLQIRLLFNLSVLTREAVVRIGEQYALVLQSLTKGADRRVSDLETLTETDQALFSTMNQTQTPYPGGSTVTNLWREQVARFPDAVALDFPGRKMSYAELDLVTDHLASRLRAGGVQRESPVALLLPRSVEFIAAALGTLKAGGTYVPIDTAYPPGRIDTIIADTGARWLLTDSNLAGFQQVRCERVLLVDREIAMDTAAARLTAPADAAEPPPGDADDAAYVMYTSGSTGAPKGIAIPHRGILRLVRNTNYVDVQPADRIGHMSNCAFDAATFEIWGALLNGATVVSIDREAVLSPAALETELVTREVGILFVTTALFNQVVAEAPRAFASLRLLMFGGEAVDPRWARVAMKAGPPRRLCHVYGPTETTTFATFHDIQEVEGAATNIPIGIPISNTTAYVLDGALRPVLAGGTGELYVGGEGLARSYHRKPALTAERFLPDPFTDRPGARMYRTGDKVRWRADGAIEFLGRYDNQIKLRGYRIELGEIERCLQRHPQVRHALAVVRGASSEDRTIAAYIVPDGAADDSLPNELRKALREELPDYMQPSSLQTINALPLNSNGKIDHSALPQPGLETGELQPGFIEPRNELEGRLAAIWQQVLGLERVGIHDVFFDIGGHSLRATQLVSRIRRELGAEIALRAIFERPTIAELAVLIQQEMSGASTAPSPITRVSRESRRRRGA